MQIYGMSTLHNYKSPLCTHEKQTENAQRNGPSAKIQVIIGMSEEHQFPGRWVR